MTRIGVFGGAFDPPHRVHRALAVAAVAQLGLQRLCVLPTGQAWHKTRPLSPAPHRLAMCRLAFAGLPELSLDDREIRRAGPTYTADTLAELRAEHPGADWYLLLGADQFLAFKTWSRWQEVLQCATLVVAGRGTEPLWPPQAPGPLDPSDLPFLPLQVPVQALSSTAIRQRLQHPEMGPATVQADLPAGVADYILQHHLYR